jgi:hypothetical protein
VALVLGSFAAAAIGDATGLVRCEQHHLGTELEMRAVGAALDDWAREHGRYPTADEGLATIADRFDAGAPPRDYFGRGFSYTPPAAGGAAYALTSLGRNGLPGGIGEDADTTWTPTAADGLSPR